jgi:tryptophan synthase beta chain
MPKDRHSEGRFGKYGGSYIPETLVPPIQELERAYAKCRKDPLFKTICYYLNEYAGRPTPLYYAKI